MSEMDPLNQLSTELMPLSEWLVEQLRLTALLDLQSEVEYSSWWLDVVGEPPDARLDEPKVGKHTERGSVSEDQKLLLEIQPGRLDWRLGVSEPDASIDAVPNIGSLPDVLQTFCELMSRWFETDNLPPIARLAFGAIVLYPVKDRQTGYQRLAPYLPVDLDPIGSSDFVYQINRRRDSNIGIPELGINRLSRWSVMHSVRTRFALDPAGLTTAASPTRFACRLQLDINTVSEFPDTLPGEQMYPIFRELVELGEEIVLRGDIP